MISFEDARAIVTAKLLPDWNAVEGTFYVADYGWENDQFYSLAVGAKEFLVDGNRDFFVVDDVLYLVEKKTGRYVETVAYENLDFLKTLTPVGDVPEEDHQASKKLEPYFKPTQEDFEESLDEAIRGGIRTCTGLNEQTNRALERIADSYPDVTQELIYTARREFDAIG